jgi:hypothetical protein
MQRFGNDCTISPHMDQSFRYMAIFFRWKLAGQVQHEMKCLQIRHSTESLASRVELPAAKVPLAVQVEVSSAEPDTQRVYTIEPTTRKCFQEVRN